MTPSMGARCERERSAREGLIHDDGNEETSARRSRRDGSRALRTWRRRKKTRLGRLVQDERAELEGRCNVTHGLGPEIRVVVRRGDERRVKLEGVEYVV